MLTLLIVLLSLALILVAIMKFDIHPFLALFVGALVYGLLAGMPGELIVKSVNDGFGSVLGRIGILILLGVMIGSFLEHTGGAMVIGGAVTYMIGRARGRRAESLIVAPTASPDHVGVSLAGGF